MAPSANVKIGCEGGEFPRQPGLAENNTLWLCFYFYANYFPAKIEMALLFGQVMYKGLYIILIKNNAVVFSGQESRLP